MKGVGAVELSLCMIVRNEEEHLGRCLESVGDAVDEIVIVDTGSTDKTKSVAARYTQRIYDYTWQDDFAAARNEAFAYATKPFMMWLDADDVLEEGGQEKLLALKAGLTEEVDAVMLPYHCGLRADGTPALVFERERIIRRGAGLAFAGAVHEAIPLRGRVIREDIAVRHLGREERNMRRNVEIFEKGLAAGREMMPRDWYYYARELMECGEPARAEAVFEAFLLMDGWLPNRIDAHLQRGKCLDILGKPREAREQYLAAMAYGVPQAEALCAMGGSMLEGGDPEAAAFWYRAALEAVPQTASGAFVCTDTYTYIPAIQLCVCYDRLGRREEARLMNERALAHRPDDPSALANREYFERVLS